MAQIKWTAEYEIGIPVIDGQHRRIVDYINDLDEAARQHDQQITGRVIDDLVDYTYSHFAFEESLMEEAGYAALSIHQNTHKSFVERLDALKTRYKQGEEVALDLAQLLQTWLLQHIVSDDASYAPLVRREIPRIESHKQGNWLSGALKRFFG